MSRILLFRILFLLSRPIAACTLLSLHPHIATADELSGDNTQESRLIDHMTLQSGGYLGFIAVGVGKDFGRHKINTMLGYLPRNVGGVEIWQLNFKYDWHPSQVISIASSQSNFQLDPFYIGLSLIYGHHNDLFLALPKNYPAGYYPPTALRYSLNIGASLQQGRHTLFLEYTVLDAGLVAFIKNPEYFIDNYDYLGLESIGALALGVKYKF